MSVARVTDRLQPALLDRLRDDDPASKVEPIEARVMSRRRLREAVLRDLNWLFNCARLSDSVDMSAVAQARRSVLDFGLPALSGHTASSIDAVALEGQVRQAILDHEPRILAASLRVEAIVSEQQLDHRNQISFRIAGQLWSQPVPLELLLHTDIDLETGRVDVRELSR